MTAREALEIATRGGAAVLGRDDIGSLEAGKCADFFSIDLHTVDYAGALNDPVAATLFCAPQKARYTVINGRVVVENGEVVTVDMAPVIEAHNRSSLSDCLSQQFERRPLDLKSCPSVDKPRSARNAVRCAACRTRPSDRRHERASPAGVSQPTSRRKPSRMRTSSSSGSTASAWSIRTRTPRCC